MTQTAVSVDPRALGVRSTALRVVLACLAVGLVIGVSGAAANREQVVEWILESLVGAGLGLMAARWLVPYAWYRTMQWAAALMIAAIITLPMSALVLACIVFLRREPVTLAVVRHVLPSVFGTSLVMTALAFLVRRHPTETHAAPANAPQAKFLDRLPGKLKGADLYAVEAEDHYLRLHTSLGQDLILMRLGDAIDELEGLEGAQTHRSWWVAKAAVTGVERLDGRAVLALKGGAEAPVSRGFAKGLRAAGWL